jgi:AraC-like DNA-binding protein
VRTVAFAFARGGPDRCLASSRRSCPGEWWRRPTCSVSLAQRSAEGWTRSLFGHLSSLRRPAFDSVVAEAVEEIAREPRLALPDLARRLAISERQLRRRFGRSVGLPPSTFARVTRMHRALRLAARRDRLWGTVAFDAGFSDQAHLSREIHALTGHSPAVLMPRPAPAH